MLSKREFLGVLGAAVGLTPAQIRILGGPRKADDADLERQRSAEFARLVAGVKVGGHRSHWGLHVFWLHGASAPSPLVVATLEEAQERGELTITERVRPCRRSA